MKKYLTGALLCLSLMGVMSGCGEYEEMPTVDLLDPVGVQMDLAEVKTEEIYTITTYDAEVVPYVEELQFVTDGVLGEIHVQLGDEVKEGQVLASLDIESAIGEIEVLEEEIADIVRLGEYSDRQMIADVEIAQIELEQLLENRASKQACSLKEVDVEKQQLKLEQARELRQMEIEEIKRKMNLLKEATGNNELVAPFDGRIVYVSNMSEGAAIQGYTTAMCIADDNKVSLSTDFISESMLNNVDKIYAQIGDKQWNIKYIPTDMSEYLSKVLNGIEVKTNLELDAQPGEIECGQFAVIFAIDNYREDVLTIPVNALYRDASGKYVYKIENGKRIRCNVTVGVETDTKVEIMEGLQEGDMVYVKE